jgi:hypothetical protein
VPDACQRHLDALGLNCALICGGHFLDEDRNADEKATGKKHANHFTSLAFYAKA